MLTKRHLRWRLLALAIGPGSVAACSGSAHQEQVFCYRTLADVSCYRQPNSGREAQLVGTYLRDVPPENHAGGKGSPAAPTEEETVGWIAGVLVASAELVGRVLAPVGPILGLFR